MKKPLNIAIAGATGRMGLALIRALSAHKSLELMACGIRAGTAQLAGTQFEQAGLTFAKELMVEDNDALFKADAVIDFTRPENTIALAGLAAQHTKILVSGTTGLNAKQKEALIHAGEKTQVIWSSNMSVGVNVLMALVEQTAGRLGNEYDLEITEMHHKHKVDSPSGTALSLGEAAAQGRKVNLNDVAVKTRDGIVGARKDGTIGFTSLRGGDVIGDHSVIFAGPGETLTLSHHAGSRDIFALGALRACEWAAGKPAGFYTMRDVIA